MEAVAKDHLEDPILPLEEGHLAWEWALFGVGIGVGVGMGVGVGVGVGFAI